MPENQKSARFRNYATAFGIVLPAVTGLILGLVANLRGEPQAVLTYQTLQEKVNKQTEHIEQLQEKLEYMEGFIQGFTIGRASQRPHKAPKPDRVSSRRLRTEPVSEPTPDPLDERFRPPEQRQLPKLRRLPRNLDEVEQMSK